MLDVFGRSHQTDALTDLQSLNIQWYIFWKELGFTSNVLTKLPSV